MKNLMRHLMLLLAVTVAAAIHAADGEGESPSTA